MSWREFFIYGINFLNLPAGTGALFTPGMLRFDADADFDFQKTVFFATSGNIRIRLQDDTVGRYLIKNSANLRDIGGGFIGTPFIWPRPYSILAGTTMTVEVADASGAVNNLRLAFHGAKIRPGDPPWGHFDPSTNKIIWRRYRAVVPFVYNSGVVNFAANASTTIQIAVDNDAHFLVQKITGFTLGGCLLEFREAAKDIGWQNTGIYPTSILGNGQFPNVLFSNRFILRGSVVSLNVQDLSAAANQVEVNLIGVKLYE